MIDNNVSDVRTSYDRVATEYAQRIAGELAHKPLDRALLDRFADAVRPLGPACDLGCGPGHVAGYLHKRGLPVFGVDLSPSMVEQARALNPGIVFTVGDMRTLGIGDGALGGIAAFYSLIHIPRAEIVAVLTELRRVLRPGGLALLAFHIGAETLHLEEWWGQAVSVDFLFFRPDEMAAYLGAAGFAVDETVEREPYPDVEHPSRRAYLFARKPDAAVSKSPMNSGST